ncbi:MAG: alkaline phosphatase [Chloracidobacterium sp.]|nr:alkaline phosphatase [Chloracidobacterium sp.]
MSGTTAQQPTRGKAKNVILFIGDGLGVSSLNAASIYGYGKALGLYVQQMPRLALADTSTTHEWVTDAAASVTAIATGVKTRNGVLSQSGAAERGVKDGANLKTILEYAEEGGLATGVIGNEERKGVADAPLAAFYAHSNDRNLIGACFLQLLNPKFGDGPDVVIGAGRKLIEQQIKQAGKDWTVEAKAKGFALADSFAALEALNGRERRVIGLWDDAEFDLAKAALEAIQRLSQNPNGFLLVIHSDCHLPNNARRNLERIIELDNAVKAAAQAAKHDETLLLVTADHSFDLRIKGEQLTETQKSSPHERIALAVSMEAQHTAEEVPVLASGPGSERVQGYISNTDVFHLMMDALGLSAK